MSDWIANLRRTRYFLVAKSADSGALGRWRMVRVILDVATGTVEIKSPWWALLYRVDVRMSPQQVADYKIELIHPALRDGLLLWLICVITQAKMPVIRIGNTCPSNYSLRSFRTMTPVVSNDDPCRFER